MKYIGDISSEGGPLLIADAATAKLWRGADGDGSDYERACDLFNRISLSGGAVSIGQTGKAVVWNMQDAGTGDVFMEAGVRLTIVGAWLDDSEDTETLSQLAQAPLHDANSVGSLEVTSEALAILWAPESGECIQAFDAAECQRPTGEMSIDSSGLLVRLANGHYVCLCDEVQLDKGLAGRIHLVRR